MIKLITYLLQSIIIYIFFIFGKIIGISLSRKFFSYLFSKIGPIFKSKKVIEKNLNIFSKNLSDIEKKNIILNMWKNYGKTFIEYIFLNNFKKDNSHIQIDGIDNLQKILKLEKPVIFVSGHFANYELMSMEIIKKNIKLATIYRPLNNYFLNPFMEFLRRKFVCKNQIKKGMSGVRVAIDYIKKGYSVALMIDQRVSEGDPIDFFGKSALTTTLPAQLALKFELSIVPVFIERDQNDNFKIKFYKEILAKEFNNKFDLTKKLNKIIEEMIIYKPENWIWTHNRWK
tara:strand:+ start:4847 stop:5704 length:858 start_codon:yes stop_codon:yes gene_type:complete